ncbi:MAG: signal peptidase II, partial [Pseudomonadota bacterium]
MLTRARIEGLGLAAVVFAIDRAIKAAMTGPLALPSRGVIDLLPFFDFRYAENYGVSFGMFSATSIEMRLGLIVVTALIATGVLIWMLRETLRGDIIGLALILGGAVGNIFDRLA